MKVGEIRKINEEWVGKIPALEEFLKTYRAVTLDYYHEKLAEYHAESLVVHESVGEELRWTVRSWGYAPNALRDKIAKAGVRMSIDEESRYYADIRDFLHRGKADRDEVISKTLDREIDQKRADLIHRCTQKVGEITDVAGLYLGVDGRTINGVVVGVNGRAQVTTIGAGGYNIQRYHYRLLIKSL